MKGLISALFLLSACSHIPTGRVNEGGGNTTLPNVINGTPGDDILEGTSGPDIINGGAGNDIICGGPCSPDLIKRVKQYQLQFKQETDR